MKDSFLTTSSISRILKQQGFSYSVSEKHGLYSFRAVRPETRDFSFESTKLKLQEFSKVRLLDLEYEILWARFIRQAFTQMIREGLIKINQPT